MPLPSGRKHGTSSTSIDGKSTGASTSATRSSSLPVPIKKLRFFEKNQNEDVEVQGYLQGKEGTKSEQCEGKVKFLDKRTVLENILHVESDVEEEDGDDQGFLARKNSEEEANTTNGNISQIAKPMTMTSQTAKTTTASAIITLTPFEHQHVTTTTTTSMKISDQPSISDSRKTSMVWNHFHIGADRRYAECNHCEKIVSRGRNLGHLNNTNMKYHLEKAHRALLLVEEADPTVVLAQASSKPQKESSSTDCVQQQHSPPLPRQATIEQMGWCPSTISQSKKQAISKVATQHIAVMIAVDDQPLQIVENEGFKRLIHFLAPYYKLPSRTTFSCQVLPSLYTKCRAEMQIVIARAKGRSIHLTTDIWTSMNAMYAYLSLTAHWWQLDEALPVSSGNNSTSSSKKVSPGYRWALLHAQVLDKSHTSENILQAIQGMMEGWNGLLRSSNKELLNGYFITDNGANIVKALADGGLKGIQCFAHMLHLVVRDALGLSGKEGDTSQVLKQLIEKCRKIAEHFNCSVKSGKQLRERQIAVGAPLHNLVQDVPTRWNSTYLMLERFSEQQTPLHDLAVASEIGLESPLGCQDWTNIAQMVHVLKPFKEYTDALSSATATLGDVIPAIYYLEQVLEKFLHQPEFSKEVLLLVKCLKEQVQKRLKPVMQRDCYMLAAMCDPRVKGSFAHKCNALGHWKRKLIRVVEILMSKRVSFKDDDDELGTSSSQSPTPSCSTASTSFSPPMRDQPHPKFHELGIMLQSRASLVGRIVSGADQQQYLQEKLSEIHVKSFLSEPVQSMDTDPLRYWAQKASMWPELAIVAQHFLSCPPTSVQSERVFSITGNIVSPHRARLSPDLVEQLVFIKMNFPLLGYPEVPCEWEEE
ncbi:zinc finger BED domain-containing protein 4-like [Rhinatrema bivittatum]|uniref:zinc finger BED domain-containing protein 4-like n=1 Tax=Rhinatrema bivittatum TaxID=194408 RepID=UPI00112E36BD|nr:zinc finger BED domain-containing protein 4-like [Rhinatrema bivittatum]